jgi:hypothetical protein
MLNDIIAGAFLRAARSWLFFSKLFRVLFLGKIVFGQRYLSGVPSFRILLSFSYMYFYQLTRTNVEYTVIRCNLLDRVNGHCGLFSLLSSLMPESPLKIPDYTLLILLKIKMKHVAKPTDNLSYLGA